MSDPELDDFEEAQQEKELRKKKAYWIGGIALFFVLAMAVGAKACSGGKRDAAKLTLHSAVAKFEANPVDPALAQAAIAECEAAGKKAEAEKIRAQHAAAVAGGGKDREAELRGALAENAEDDTALGQLVEIYVKRKDVEGARKAWEEFTPREASAKRHANFGAWLYRNGLVEPAAKELARAVKGGHPDPYTKAYLGLCYAELGRKKEAQKLLYEGIEGGVELDIVRAKAYELDQELDAKAAKKGKK